MLDNLKLKGRILGGYSVPIFLSVLATGVVFLNVSYVKNRTEMTKAAYAIVDDTKDMIYSISGMQKFARGHIIAKNETSLTRYEQAKTEFLEHAQNLKELIQDSQQQESLNQIIALGERVDSYNQKLIALVNQGKGSEAISIWAKGEGRELSAQLDELLDQFEAREKEILEERQEAQASALGMLPLTVTLSTIISSILAIAFGLLIANAIAKLLEQSASKVASSSTEIASTVEQQERTISQQAVSVNETTTTMDQLGASSLQAAAQAEASASGARQALSLADTGTKAVHQTMQEMSTLKQQVGAIAEQIMRLSEQTGQIASVSELVADLANQTNILALNAAVEAARAGENGKGFSVVASEIRKLADESKKSAEKISNLVSDIQAAMNSTVMVTDEGTKKAEQSIKLAQETAQTFVGVSDAVNNVFLNTQQISLSAKQQAVAVQQVVAAMNAINLGSQETASGINQVKTSIQQLNDAAKKLQAVV